MSESTHSHGTMEPPQRGCGRTLCGTRDDSGVRPQAQTAPAPRGSRVCCREQRHPPDDGHRSAYWIRVRESESTLSGTESGAKSPHRGRECELAGCRTVLTGPKPICVMSRAGQAMRHAHDAEPESL